MQLIWACDVYLGPWFRLHLHWLRSVVHRSTSPQKHRLSIPSECLSLCLPAACSPSLSVCLYTFHSLCLYVCRSVSMTVCHTLSVGLYVRPVSVFVCLSLCVCVCLSLYVFVLCLCLSLIVFLCMAVSICLCLPVFVGLSV